MKQFLEVIVTVKFIVEATAALAAGLIRIRAAIVPPAVELTEMGGFPSLLPRFVPSLPRFAGLSALTVSTNCRPRGSFAGGKANRRFADRTD